MRRPDSPRPEVAERFLAELRGTLASFAPELPSRMTVALSGGLDSTVLLAALVRLSLPVRLRAAYVDHGLHPDAAQWGARCAELAAALGVEWVAVRVTVDDVAGVGLEAAARDARYRALAGVLEPGEWLLTAHHGDDQLETVLLRLLRGTGVRGLRGILAFGAFAGGFLARPLLTFARAELRAAALEWGLSWLEDPANRDLRHDRNFLRLRVLPEVLARWPSAVRHAQRLAAQMAEAEEILEGVAREDARSLAAPWCIPAAALHALPAARQHNLLRFALREVGLGTPSARKLDELCRALLEVRPGAQPLVRWPGAEGRVFRDALYLMPALGTASPQGLAAALDAERRWQGPEGSVQLVPSEADGLPDAWVAEGLAVRFRGGGERFKPLGQRHHRTLKQLFQASGLVPWMRDRVPLLYRGSTLVAVGDEWLTADVEAAAPGARRWRVIWADHPPVRAPKPA
jgi:tRNA(Ile)-lysidine synthase